MLHRSLRLLCVQIENRDTGDCGGGAARIQLACRPRPTPRSGRVLKGRLKQEEDLKGESERRVGNTNSASLDEGVPASRSAVTLVASAGSRRRLSPCFGAEGVHKKTPTLRDGAHRGRDKRASDRATAVITTDAPRHVVPSQAASRQPRRLRPSRLTDSQVKDKQVSPASLTTRLRARTRPSWRRTPTPTASLGRNPSLASSPASRTPLRVVRGLSPARSASPCFFTGGKGALNRNVFAWKGRAGTGLRKCAAASATGARAEGDQNTRPGSDRADRVRSSTPGKGARAAGRTPLAPSSVVGARAIARAFTLSLPVLPSTNTRLATSRPPPRSTPWAMLSFFAPASPLPLKSPHLSHRDLRSPVPPSLASVIRLRRFWAAIAATAFTLLFIFQYNNRAPPPSPPASHVFDPAGVNPPLWRELELLGPNREVVFEPVEIEWKEEVRQDTPVPWSLEPLFPAVGGQVGDSPAEPERLPISVYPRRPVLTQSDHMPLASDLLFGIVTTVARARTMSELWERWLLPPSPAQGTAGSTKDVEHDKRDRPACLVLLSREETQEDVEGLREWFRERDLPCGVRTSEYERYEVRVLSMTVEMRVYADKIK